MFRHRSDASAEFLQAGIEIFGRPDKAAADAEMLALGLEATAHYGLASPDIQIGDVALFAGLIAGLDLPPAWKRRLVKDFNRKSNLAQDLDRLVLGGNNSRPEYQGVLAALAGSDPHGAHALVTDLLSIAGINAVGGRSVAEIAERFLEQSALGASAKLPRDVRALIERFLDDRRRPRRGGGGAARARRRSQHDADAGAGHRPVRNPHRLFGRARHRPEARALLHRLRARLRLLHRLRVRTDRSEAHRRSAGRRRPL